MTAKLFQLKFFILGNITVDHEHILTRANEPRKFSSEFEVPCPSAKLFHLERFAIYGIVLVFLTVNDDTCMVGACIIEVYLCP